MSSKKMVFLFMLFFISIMLGSYLLDLIAPLTVQSNYGVYSGWRAKERMVDLMEPGSTVIFGDSTAHGGYKPDEINSHVYNFALDGATPIEAYFLLRYMLNNGKRPKNIILTFESTHYSTSLSNYWDMILSFHLNFITRSDAEEILSIDQNSAIKLISPYDKNIQGETVHIPYYYDVAIGPLKQIKLNFNEFIKTVIKADNVKRIYFKTRGSGYIANVVQRTPLCTDKDKFTPVTESWPSSVILHYLERLINVAIDQKINVYVMGGPIAESCAGVGFPIDWVKFTPLEKFKSIHFEYAQAIILPDTLMMNRNHATTEGASYFSQKVKPFFDAIE